MSAHDLTATQRGADFFHHIDMGYLNERKALSALPAPLRDYFSERKVPGDDHLARLANQHLLVTILLDYYQDAPTLLEALASGKPRLVFRSTERLAAFPDLRQVQRVEQEVLLDVEFGKPVVLAYHTSHLVSDTGRLTLSEGAPGGYAESMLGVLEDRGDRWEISPVVMGAPTLDHPRNGGDEGLMWLSLDHGEILPEDIDQFSRMSEIRPADADEWMSVMKRTSEDSVKRAFAELLAEPAKSDWGGERNDHYSAAVTIGGRRRTAAFLLKGPTRFREMSLEMCGARADQVLRLAQSGADISVVQHAHLIGEAVRLTLKGLTVHPGRARKFCLIDGQATYRILKAYGYA